MIRQIEVHIESFDAREQLDLGLWKHHAADRMIHVRQRQVGKRVLVSDCVGSHASELVPGESAFQFCSWPDRYRFAARHFYAFIDATAEIVTFFQETLVSGRDAGFVRLVAGAHYVEWLFYYRRKGGWALLLRAHPGGHHDNCDHG